MADINSITNAASYVGNKELGGYIPDAIQIDTKPLADLARYTVIYHEAEYKQRQADAEKTAAELAGIASIDFSKIDEQWRAPIAEAYQKLTDYTRVNPESFNYAKNPKGWLEYNQKKNDVLSMVKNGTANQVLKEGREAKIANETNVEIKTRLQSSLDRDVKSTGLNQSLPHEEKYNIEFAKIPAPKNFEFTVLTDLNNSQVSKKYSLTDYADIDSQANLMSIGVDSPLNTSDKSYTDASPKDQERMKEQEAYRKIFVDSGWKKMGIILNDAIKGEKYLTEGKVDINKLLADSETAKYAQMFVDYNANAKRQLDNINNGVYDDKFEGRKKIPSAMINPASYVPINIQDGVSDKELIKVLMAANAPASKEVGEEHYTGNANARLNTTLDYKVGMANANNKANDLAFDKQKWKDQQDRFISTQKGGETVKNGAWIKAQDIYNDLKKLADVNGVISPENLRKINQEQRKYMGGETVVKQEDGTLKTFYTPLTFADKTAIQLVNGEIRVMNNAEKLENGTYQGLWDNEKNTNISNMATNRLNEENKNAGSKEINTYLGLDVVEGQTESTSGGSKSTSTGGGYLEIKTVNGVKWGRKSDGSIEKIQ